MDVGNRFTGHDGRLYEVVGHYSMSYKTQAVNPETGKPGGETFSMIPDVPEPPDLRLLPRPPNLDKQQGDVKVASLKKGAGEIEMFPLQAEKLQAWMADEWALYASGTSIHKKRLVLEVKIGAPVARVWHGDGLRKDSELLHEGDIDYALALFNQNVRVTPSRRPPDHLNR